MGKRLKWLSVKKYIPPTGKSLLIRAAPSEGHWERYFIGWIDDLSCVKDLPTWELYPASYPDLCLEDYRVTHFAQIDAVEIEQ